MKIAIIGAGIGGLTAAALLQEQGHTIKVFEKNESVKEIGAGIGIGDNVLKKLGNHDLAKGIKNAGQILSTMTVLDDKDRPLTTVKLKSNTLNVTLPRQTLIDIIKSYVKDDAIFTNHEVTHIDNETDKVTIHFAEQESEAFDLCIGADGIHSKVRQSVNADSKVLYQGYTCFRGLIDDIDLKHPDCAKEYWGRKRKSRYCSVIK
ncbi:Salicylate hydroxylase [Staphylococcus aureus]|nr:Salicylate hydroxylase [Staphylococcus aureus]